MKPSLNIYPLPLYGHRPSLFLNRWVPGDKERHRIKHYDSHAVVRPSRRETLANRGRNQNRTSFARNSELRSRQWADVFKTAAKDRR